MVKEAYQGVQVYVTTSPSEVPGVRDFRPNPHDPLTRDETGSIPPIGIDGPFRRNARETPNAVAVQDSNVVLTYADLETLSTEFAARLLDCITADASHPVILYARRSAALIVAMLGTIRAGRTFAILDAAYPVERVRLQASVLSPALLVGVDITSEQLREVFTPSQEVPCLSYAIEHPPRNHKTPAAIDEPANPTAYLLFTSGTTGTPKCIRTGHAPLLHFVEFYRRTFQPASSDRFSMLSGLSHDPLLRDIFVPLSCGARIVVPDETTIRSPVDLYAWLADTSITFVHATPQLLRLLSSGKAERPQLTELTYVFSGGDVLLRDNVEAVRAVAPHVSIVNFYGSSETPQAMGFHVVRPSETETQIPLGRGIDDVQLLVLDANLRMTEVGVIGQIAIRTRFLSDGYVNDPGDTSMKFVTSPFTGDPNDRIYLTGDFGYYRPDGAVVGTGRKDDQVKIRGYRVELAEVRRAIEGTGLVENAVALVHATSYGENRLVAFVLPASAKSVGNAKKFTDTLREALLAKLPAAMVPSRITCVDAMPLTPNGKVDRKALISLIKDSPPEDGASLRFDPELDQPVRSLIAIIEDVLELKIDSLDRSFIDLGGDSLSYVRVCTALQDAIGFLPREWASRPLREFSILLTESDRPRTRSSWVPVELPVLLRAISIVLVVMNHAVMGAYLAATSTLFVVSGVSFNRFLAPTIRRTGKLSPALRFVFRFGVPAMLWQMMRSVWLHIFWLPNLFLLGTFFQNPSQPLFTLWYLDVLAANVLIMALALKLGHRLRRAHGNHSDTASAFIECVLLLGVGIGVAAAQIQSGWWDGVVGESSVAPFKWFWLLALGMVIAEARDTKKRIIATLLSVGLGVSGYVMGSEIQGFDDMLNPFFIVSVGIMPWVASVPLPRIIQRPLVVIARSTLFIYIVNYSVIYQIMPRVGMPPWLVLRIVLPVLVGVIATSLWDRVHRINVLAFQRLFAILRQNQSLISRRD